MIRLDFVAPVAFSSNIGIYALALSTSRVLNMRQLSASIALLCNSNPRQFVLFLGAKLSSRRITIRERDIRKIEERSKDPRRALLERKLL